MYVLIRYDRYPWKHSRCDIQVDTEADLQDIPETVQPGTVAYTGDLRKMWNKANDGSWKQI